ncbi:hypothetical protein VTN49DRAFT_4387 [Thermomyces lanuginosus]|uniref:mitochondrial 37S ribosomal protein uS11m n=1 Tax=Thermomyces lanuginosus TaxID=5541 RepID=UPI003742F28A
MKARLWNMAMALPSACRGCQQRLAMPFGARFFSAIRPLNEQGPPREKVREIERQILQPESAEKTSTGETSGLSAITQMMQGERRQQTSALSRDYSQIVAAMESELIKNPYVDRAPPHHLHVYSHKHNTIITLTRPNGDPIMSLGCGNLGFRKSQRAGYDPAFQLTIHVFAKIQERGLLMDIKRLELIFRGFGQGRDAFIKVLLGNEGRHIRPLISSVTDNTKIKFGGARSRKVRRLG